MNDDCLVSILINNYNYGRFIGDAIDSALNQTYANTEVIVVDDGSTDNSREIITEYKRRIHPILKENGGQASAFNAGFAASKGDIICFLDSDDYFVREKIETIVKIFKENRNIGWVFHALRILNVREESPEEKRNGLPSGLYDFRPQLKRGRVPFPGPATSGLCFSRTIASRILPMPLAPDISLSDKYLKRLSMALSPGVYIDQPLAVQRIHSDNAFTRRDDKQRLKAKINILTAYWMRRNFPQFSTLANATFAFGISEFWSMRKIDAYARSFVNEYLSNTTILAKLEIGARAIYYHVKHLCGRLQRKQRN